VAQRLRVLPFQGAAAAPAPRGLKDQGVVRRKQTPLLPLVPDLPAGCRPDGVRGGRRLTAAASEEGGREELVEF
jgi:hypothetical protein